MSRSIPATRLCTGILLLVSVFLSPATAVSAETQLPLTAEEQQFVREHPLIRMCVDPRIMPFEMLDDNGQHLGMVAHYMDLIAQQAGLEFQLVPTSSWSESLQVARQSKCDILSALNQTADRATYLIFSEPYISAWAALGVRNEGTDTIWGLEYMAGRKLAVVQDDFHDEVVSRDYPEIQRVHVADITEGLSKVASGEVDAAIGPLLVVAYQVQQLDLDNLAIMGRTRYQNLLRIGVRQDYPLLVSIFNKAIKTLTPQDALRIRRAVFN